MIFIIENVKFKTQGNKVFIDNIQISHPQKTLVCLKLFLQSNNEVLSKDHLMNQIWPDIVVSDDSLFKVIQEVRNIFKKHDLSGSTITNIYGKGYKVQPEIRYLSEENKTTHKVFLILIITFLIAIILGYFLQKNNTKNQIPQQDFQQLVTSINSKFTGKTINLDKFAITEQSSTLDRIRISYLQGLIHYKKGDYDNCVKVLNSTLHLFKKNEPDPAMADTYLLLSKIYIYKNDKELLKQYLDNAQYFYNRLNDNKGLISTTISRARFHQTLNQYPQSIELLNQVLINAESEGDKHSQMRAYTNLAYSYQQTNNPSDYQYALEQSLKLALETSNGTYASLAYGALATVKLNNGQYKKAMQFAQNTLKYAIAENDTNAFQQGYSSFYNILSDLGHDELAQKNLNRAIDIQENFNPEARLIEAETNLAILKIKQKKYDEAHQIFIDLLNLQITDNEINRVQSWMALNDYYRKDNISAYTLAKTCLNFPDKKHRLLAYLALSLSSHELERSDEAIKAFEQAEALVDSDWLNEYTHFLDAALLFYTEVIVNEQQRLNHLQLKNEFDKKMVEIKNQTLPDASLLNELQDHLNQIL